ncbi:hypothetical protein VDG1235_4414 [Verrucomicrobiia bacterium DG1235]|nr:hypothetical protein VDG1235_4414 [Verrucomicrobiae bacterium DG1235]
MKFTLNQKLVGGCLALVSTGLLTGIVGLFGLSEFRRA